MSEYRIYSNRKHFSPATSLHLNDICRALWSELPFEIRLKRFGSRTSHFVFIDSPMNSDVILLPLNWNYYFENNATSLVTEEIELTKKFNKNFALFSQGDYTANLPFSHVTLFELSSYASRRNKQNNKIFAIPAFIPDYLNLYCKGHLQLREKKKNPVVGFCGQAGGSWLDFTRRSLILETRKLSYAFGWRKWEPSPYETTQLRKRILTVLAQSSGISKNFLIRRRYRAGYLSDVKDPFHPTRLEFVQNILNSDYTICVRGSGNFSARFYETLALGRIPVFVNTDCILPYDQIINYKQYCVWVEESEIPQIGQKILAFHESLSPSQFIETQMSCYSLWHDWLSMDGFYSHFPQHFINHKNESENPNQVVT